MRRLAIALVVLGGCSLFETLPDNKCTKTSDCYQAQGETCDQDTKTCVAAPDAQIVTPTAAPVAAASEQP